MSQAPLADGDARMRHELGLLYSEVALEIRERSNGAAPGRLRPSRPAGGGTRRGLERQAAMLALQGAGRLATALRDWTGRDVIDLGALQEVIRFAARQRDLARRGAAAEIDEFGFDQEWTEALLPIFEWVYRRYWRVETVGIENVPAQGRALLVANHAGVLPWDGAMIKTALFLEHRQPRHARALVASFVFDLPGFSWMLRRSGQATGHPDDSRRLLEQDQVVLVFPEGVKGTGKPYRERYRLRRFGRGGFARAAIRTGSPIIPVSVVGSEEIYPMIGDLGGLAKTTGFPYFPVTPFWPWLGPLGLVPLPSRWRIQFHPPVPTGHLDPEAAEDQNLVMTLTDQVRDTVQVGILEQLKLRRRTYF